MPAVIPAWLAERVLESAELRRAEGRLEFHDLLVLARNLLRNEAQVRAALQERYQRLLLDEFQRALRVRRPFHINANEVVCFACMSNELFYDVDGELPVYVKTHVREL